MVISRGIGSQSIAALGRRLDWCKDNVFFLFYLYPGSHSQIIWESGLHYPRPLPSTTISDLMQCIVGVYPSMVHNEYIHSWHQYSTGMDKEKEKNSERLTFQPQQPSQPPPLWETWRHPGLSKPSRAIPTGSCWLAPKPSQWRYDLWYAGSHGWARLGASQAYFVFGQLSMIALKLTGKNKGTDYPKCSLE